MNLCRLALALGAAVPFAAHASDQAPLMRRYPGYPPGDYGYQPQARQGLLLSIGLGGGYILVRLKDFSSRDSRRYDCAAQGAWT